MNIATSLGHKASIPRNTVTWLLIAILFFLRIVIVGLVPALMKNSPSWAVTTYEVGTYFVIVAFIWWERHNLSDFFIDRLALIILILGKPYELLLYKLQIPFTYPLRSEVYWLYLPTACGLLLVSRFIYPRLRKIDGKNWLWLLAGIAAGVVLGIMIGYVQRYQFSGATEPLTSSLMFFLPTQQLVSAAIAEEPFFRGFLWGALRRSGWKDGWILIFQAVLFMIAHVYYFGNNPVSFWIFVPFGGLVMGLFAWRSHSIATSMVTHGFGNAVAQMMIYYRF